MTIEHSELAANWPHDLASREADAAGLTVIGDLAGVTQKTPRSAALARFHAVLRAAVPDPDIWAPIEFAAIDYANAAATDAIDDLMARIRGDAQ